MATTGQKLAAAGATILVAEPALAIAHTGPVGIIVGLALGAIAYTAINDIEETTGRDISLPAPATQRNRTKNADKPSFAKRMLVGKSTREESQEEPKAENTSQASEATEQNTRPQIPSQFKLDSVLDTIDQVNAAGCVYFGHTTTGPVAINLSDMYHVLDVSSSGKGKSNRFRLALMQLVGYCEVYYINPLAANVKAVDDERKIEVWKPIYNQLANGRPIKTGDEIQALMQELVNELETRATQEDAGDFSWRERPVFVFIDELPEVMARAPKVAPLLDKIGRTGRQYKVFAWVASQTAAVAETGQSTAGQAQYKTRIYGGGDRTSSSRLMKCTIPMEAERALQSNKAGLTLMLADGMAGLEYVRAPLVTNEALFRFLGLPPFRLADWLRPPEEKTTEGLPAPEQARDNNLSRFTPAPEEQKEPKSADGTVKDEVKGERVKAPNEAEILATMETLEAEDRPLTLHAIAKRAGLTWHQYDDIEQTAIFYGYELERGKGRPAKTESYRS